MLCDKILMQSPSLETLDTGGVVKKFLPINIHILDDKVAQVGGLA